MIAVLSPAKTLDLTAVASVSTQPRLLNRSEELVEELRQKSAADIQELMHVSEQLAVLNRDRFQAFERPFTADNAKPSILAFKGDVYKGLSAEDFTDEDLAFAQNSIRILSGLYGVLRPQDLMQAYRLEMGTKLQTAKGKNLYEFWGSDITSLLNEDLAATKSKHLVNLASIEYFKSIQTKALNATLINVHFKENRNGKLRVIAFNAKKARGAMARLIVKNRLTEVEELKALCVNDYLFSEDLSNESDYVFVKG